MIGSILANFFPIDIGYEIKYEIRNGINNA